MVLPKFTADPIQKAHYVPTDPTYISMRNRDIDTDFHKGKLLKAAWRRPLWGCETRQPLAVKTWNRQRHQASKPKPTPPYQALRKLLTPPSPALRKQSISLQHSKLKSTRRLVTPPVVLIQKQKNQVSRSQS